MYLKIPLLKGRCCSVELAPELLELLFRQVAIGDLQKNTQNVQRTQPPLRRPNVPPASGGPPWRSARDARGSSATRHQRRVKLLFENSS
jgi:hypothetical protein